MPSHPRLYRQARRMFPGYLHRREDQALLLCEDKLAAVYESGDKLALAESAVLQIAWVRLFERFSVTVRS